MGKSVKSPPPKKKKLQFPQTATKSCALNLSFGRDSELQIYHGNFLLMDNKHGKLFVTEPSKWCKFVRKIALKIRLAARWGSLCAPQRRERPTSAFSVGVCWAVNRDRHGTAQSCPWVGLGPNFSLAVRWVGSGHTKLGPWTTLEQYSCMSPVKTIAGVSIASAAFARLMVVTSAQTHRQTAPRLQQKTLPFLQILPTAAFLFCLGTDSTYSPRTVYRYF